MHAPAFDLLYATNDAYGQFCFLLPRILSSLSLSPPSLSFLLIPLCLFNVILGINLCTLCTRQSQENVKWNT